MGNMWDAITVPADMGAFATKLVNYHAETLGPARAGEYWWEYGNDNYAQRKYPPFNGAPSSIKSSLITTSCMTGYLNGEASPLPCLIHPNTLDLSSGAGVNLQPAVAFKYNRAGADIKLATNVIAPACTCGARDCFRDTENNLGDLACKASLGSAAVNTKDYNNHDYNGNWCALGEVPGCAVLNDKVEYIFDATVTAVVAAPHDNLPDLAPMFLLAIRSAFLDK